MRNEIINQIIELLNKNIVNGELNNSSEIQSIIDNSGDVLTEKDYYIIVYTILCKLGLETYKNVNEIFSAHPKFSIETYKKIQRIQASKAYDSFKLKKESLLISFSRNLCKDLEYLSVKDVSDKYSRELEEVGKIDKSNRLIYYMKKHKAALTSCDRMRINNTKIEIRNYIKEFNAKYKEAYIAKYVDEKIEKIKPYFKINTKKEIIYKKLNPDAFISFVLSELELSNKIKRFIYAEYGVEINNNTLKRIILNILNKKHMNNYKLLNIEKYFNNIIEDEKILSEMKSFHRLTRIYLKIINNAFMDFDKQLLVTIFNDFDNLNSYRDILTNGQFLLLNEVRTIYKEAQCNLIINDNELVFEKENALNNDDFVNIKKKCEMIKKYQKLVKQIFNYYIIASKSKTELIGEKEIQVEDIIFDDDNYKLKNVEMFMNIDILFNMIKRLDLEKIESYDAEVISVIKKIIFNGGILGCAMECKSDIDIASIINGIGSIKDYETIDLTKIDIAYLLKQTSLYGMADDFTISVLGSEVASKLINNGQFIQTNTEPEKKERLKKAVKLNLMAISRDKSAIPYDIKSDVNGVSLTRYLNDSPDILTTGIDSNTCIKLDGNDNDFLIYAMLNRQCAIFKINYGKAGRIGHMICFRQANAFFINGVRIYTGTEEVINQDIRNRNNEIFNAILKFAHELIASTTNTDYPIDFVVCNKAGILESPYFDDNYDIVPDHIATDSIDVYNDDWEEFIHLFDDEKIKYLKQVTLGKKEAFTTDFGSYPALLIASRDNRYLERKFDIAYFSADAIYDRPIVQEKAYNNNFSELLEYIYRVDALAFYEKVNDLEVAHKKYHRRKINVNEIKEVTIGNYYYKIVYNNDLIEEVRLNQLSSNNKQKIKK